MGADAHQVVQDSGQLAEQDCQEQRTR
jgi:hypothetical protein